MRSEPVEGARIFEREGDYWTIAYGGRAFRLRDSKGLHYLAELLHNPGRELHVLELAGAVADEEGAVDLGDSGVLLDAQSKAEYRRRLEELGRELEEAERFHDTGRIARARAEIEALTAELSRATGLGGRDRRAGSPAERARAKLTMAIKGALRKIADNDPELGRHLAATVKTGRFCSYAPDSQAPRWGARGAQAATQFTEPPVETPKHLAEKILLTRGELEGERKQVTVLFCSIDDSLGLSARVDPEQWRVIVERFLALTMQAVHRYEGTVSQHSGDRVTALFGAPIAHEDHAQRACHAALHIREELGRYAPELRTTHGLELAVRIGMSSGEVVVGRIGDDLRMEYTALGHTTNVAERVERIAPAGTICLAETTARLVRDFFELRARGDHLVEGVARAVSVFDLLAAGTAITSLQAAERRGFSRFVGRETELRVLESAFEAALRCGGSVLGVVGEPGIGKSRLCREIVGRIRERGTPVYEGHCPAHGKAIPYLSILELFRSYFGVVERDSPAEARSKIAKTLLSLEESFREALPLVFEFLAVPDPDDPAPCMDPQAKQKRLYTFLRALVRARSQAEPAVILIDDLHWVDDASDVFLADLVEAIEGTRTLCLVNFRPEYSAPWMRKSTYQQIGLKPLGPGEINELVRHLVGDDPSASGLGGLIRERTGGNPFFIEETVHELAETGKLEGHRGSYRLVPPLDALVLPTRVHAVLAGRIDRLERRDKETLRAAAVLGKNFPFRVLREVTGLEEDALNDSLGRLRDREFVYEERSVPEREYAFKHPLTHEVAYQSQLKRRRRATHESAARAIEKLFANGLTERYGELAHHYFLAEKTEPAIHYSRLAGDHALAQSAIVEAGYHLRKARELVAKLPATPARDELELAILLSLAMALTRGQGQADSEEPFSEAFEIARRLGDAQKSFTALYGVARSFAGQGDIEKCFVLSTQLVELAEKAESPELIVEAHSILGMSAYYRGLFTMAHASFREVGRHPEQPKRVASLSHESVCRWIEGHASQAPCKSDEAIALARRHGDRYALVVALYYRAYLFFLLQDAASVEAAAGEAVQLCERHGFAAGVAQALHGWSENEKGNSACGIAAIREGIEQLQTARHLLPIGLLVLADALGRAGQIDEADVALGELLDLAERTDLRYHEAETHRLRGEVLLRHDAADLAEAHFRRAVEIARRQQAQAWELRAVTSLARLLGARGGKEEASAVLGDVRGRLREGAETADVREADALLRQLADSSSASRPG